MSNDVTVLVSELRQDHNNMRLLLDLLEREANRLFDGHEPDYEMLHDILQYMTTYPDGVHHPKEDLLYDEIRAVRPDLSSGFQRISVDHRRLGDAGRAVRDKLAAIAAGAMVERKDTVAEALRYVNALRSHMQWEELDLFRRCLKMAREGHQFVRLEDVEAIEDPLFGSSVAINFERLYQHIRRAGKESVTAVDGSHAVI
ncbi:MAG: hemerythrin domain-containing protein [Woeseia sp.]